MKKFMILVATLFGIAVVAHAQNTVLDNPSNRAYFGLRGSLDLMFPGDLKTGNLSVSSFKTAPGVELGGIYNVPVKANFYIEPGFKLFYDTYKLKDVSLDFDDDITYDPRTSVRRFGFRIPVMAGYHFDFNPGVKLHIFTGPEMEVGIWSRAYENFDDGHQSENLYGDEGGYNRVDLSWILGAGISYRHFYFGINGAFGMLDMAKENIKLHENRLSISLGYNF